MFKNFKDLKISRKLSITLIVTIAMLLISMAISIGSLITVTKKVNTFYNGIYKVINHASDISEYFERIQKFLFLAIATDDSDYEKIESYVESSAVAGDNNGYALQEIKKIYRGDPEILKKLEDRFAVVTPIRKEVANLILENNNKEALELTNNKYIPAITEALESINELNDYATKEGENVILGLESLMYIIIIILIIIAVISIIVGTVINRLIARSIINPVTQIKESVNILATGNFDIELAYESEDELGLTAEAIRKTISTLNTYIKDIMFGLQEVANKNLQVLPLVEYRGDFIKIRDNIFSVINSLDSIMRQLQESSKQVSQGAEQLAEGAQALAEGATDQAGSVQELLAAIGDVTSQVQDNAKSAETASNQAKNVGVEAEESSDKMSHMTEAMERISQTSKQIELIIKTIEDIASQTNLLSLNAAIEAARAGDAGKGFAVVADEIRELANQSAQAAVNTRELIESSIHEVMNGNKIAASTEEAMNHVIQGITSIIDSIDQVKDASTQQASTMQQINQGIEQISSVVESNSATAEESSATSEELAAQATALSELASEFKLIKR